MNMERVFLLYSYNYLFTLLVSAAVFSLTLWMEPNKAKAGNIGGVFFEMVTIHSKQTGEKNETGSAVLSACGVFALLTIMIVADWLWGELLSHISICGYIVVSIFTIYRIGIRILPRRSILVGMSATTLGLILGTAWMVWPSWIAYDLLGMILACGCITWIQVKRLRYLVLGFVAIMLFDAIAVFGSNIMVDVVLNKERFEPGIIITPKDLFAIMESVQTNFVGVLGLGDIIFSGIVVCAARRYQLHWYVAVGYALGLGITGIVGVIYDHPMPAMIFLAPATLGSLYLGAWWNKKKLFW